MKNHFLKLILLLLLIKFNSLSAQSSVGVVLQISGKACIIQNNGNCDALKNGDQLLVNAKINVQEGEMLIFDYSTKKRASLPVGKFVAEMSDTPKQRRSEKIENLTSLQIRDTSVRSTRGDCKPDPESFKTIFGDLPFLKFRSLYCPVTECLDVTKNEKLKPEDKFIFSKENYIPQFSYYTSLPKNPELISNSKLVVIGDSKCYKENTVDKFNNSKNSLVLVRGNDSEFQILFMFLASEEEQNQLNSDLATIETFKKNMSEKDFTDLKISIYEDHKFFYDAYRIRR